jgi:protocatechuate 3,4-dioxygenase beta subunit
MSSESVLANLPEKAAPGSLAGKTVKQPDPPKPGELKQTMREIEGPYYCLGAPQRNVFLEDGDKPEIIVTGRVLNELGTPIPGATISLWMSDHDGNYDMLHHRYHGYFFTDENGEYEFTSIIPGCYFPRDSKHFHVKVQGNSSPITSQLYVEGEPGTEDDPFYSEEMLIRCKVDELGVKRGTFDFVIKQVTAEENVTPDSLAARV